MKQTDLKYDELRELLTQLSDGTQTEAHTHRLNELLRGDPEACELYLNHAALEAQLHREFGKAPAELLPGFSLSTSRMPARSKVVSVQLWLRTAAAAALAVCATWFALDGRDTERTPKTAAPSARREARVATVLFAEDCEWSPVRAVSEGERLSADKLHLMKGLAILRFDGGAEMVLRGETELVLHSATHAKLVRGDVVLRAEGEEAAGFKLDTPSASLLDLGTEFAVKVTGCEVTELHITEGAVSFEQGGVTETLQAGKAVRLEHAKPPQAITGEAPRFAQLVREANPRERPEMMIVYDGFNGKEGSYPPSSMSFGKGWAGPWRLRREEEFIGRGLPDTTTDMRIVHGEQSLPWRMNRGGIGMLEMPAGVCVRIRPMVLPLEMGCDGITYFSLITQEPVRPEPGNRTKTESLRFAFRSSTDFSGDFLSFGYGPDQKPYISGASFGNMQSLKSIPSGQSLLWIGKIIRRAEGDDEISFRIYGQKDELDYAEPKTWHVNARGVHMDASLDLLVLSSMGNAPRMVDEIRIGATWRSVVPIKFVAALPQASEKKGTDE